MFNSATLKRVWVLFVLFGFVWFVFFSFRFVLFCFNSSENVLSSEIVRNLARSTLGVLTLYTDTVVTLGFSQLMPLFERP